MWTVDKTSQSGNHGFLGVKPHKPEIAAQFSNISVRGHHSHVLRGAEKFLFFLLIKIFYEMFCKHGGGGAVEIQETETNSKISDWFLWCYRIFGFKPSPPVMVRQLFGSNTQLHNIINGFKA